MQLKNLLAFLAAACAVRATASLQPEENEVEERSHVLYPCAPKGVHVVAAGGEGSVKGDLGYLITLVTNITSRIPGSNYHQVAYPPNTDAPDSIAYADPHMRHHVHQYAAHCPHTPMVLVGYSAGAAVVMDCLCGDVTTGDDQLPTHYRKNILASIVYGDPTWTADKSYDRGTCKDGTSVVPRAYPGHCFPFGKKLRSYCNKEDPECCGGPNPNAHFTYPRKYDVKASEWVKRVLERHQKHKKH